MTYIMQLKRILLVIGVIALIGLGVTIVQDQSATNSNSNTADLQNEQSGFIITTEIDTGTESKSYEARIQEETKALALLKEIAQTNNLTLDIKSYDFGDLVEGINGVKGDTATGFYWSFYVNDEMATVGAGEYVIKEGDRIAWKYQKL